MVKEIKSGARIANDLSAYNVTDRQTVNYYSTIHVLELIFFDSNKQETMKRQFYASDSIHL